MQSRACAAGVRGRWNRTGSILVGILKMTFIPRVKSYRYKMGYLTSLGLSFLISESGEKTKQTTHAGLPGTSLIHASVMLFHLVDSLASLPKMSSLDNKLYGRPTENSTLCTWVF